MKIIMLVALGLCIATVCYAEQQFNPYSGKWETAPKGSTPQYNPYNGQWSNQPKDAKVEYNPFNGKHEWDSGHNPESDDE